VEGDPIRPVSGVRAPRKCLMRHYVRICRSVQLPHVSFLIRAQAGPLAHQYSLPQQGLGTVKSHWQAPSVGYARSVGRGRLSPSGRALTWRP